MFNSIVSLQELKSGSIVRGKLSQRIFIVVSNYGGRVTAVDVADITNPDEWEVLDR